MSDRMYWDSAAFTSSQNVLFKSSLACSGASSSAAHHPSHSTSPRISLAMSRQDGNPTAMLRCVPTARVHRMTAPSLRLINSQIQSSLYTRGNGRRRSHREEHAMNPPETATGRSGSANVSPLHERSVEVPLATAQLAREGGGAGRLVAEVPCHIREEFALNVAIIILDERQRAL